MNSTLGDRMPTAQAFDTDYLIIGAGATGLAFADTLLQESDAHITLVDRHALPGGHWNDAYPFVTLHQPSAFYGVNSLHLGSDHIDTMGHNQGLYELASGAEVNGYFQRVMRQRLLPSGRVRYLSASQYLGMQGVAGQDGNAPAAASVRNLLTGEHSTIAVKKKLVDCTFFSPQVPATTPPAFTVADGVTLLTPTQMAMLAQPSGLRPSAAPAAYCVLGAGKTAMDACIWLLTQGVAADQLHWVMPRDSWLINRLTTQPGEAFFKYSVGGVAQQMKALAQASDVNDLFARLEASGQMFRIDTRRQPSMFHYATVSEGEVALLRQIHQVIRRGRVQALERGALVFADGRESVPENTVYVNCTASAVLPRNSEPMFQPGRILPQLVRAPLVTLSAAVCAYLEVNGQTDAQRNLLSTPVPFPRNPAGWITAMLVGLQNQMAWGQDKALRNWMRDSRLDGFGKLVASVSPGDAEKTSILAELRQYSMAAVQNGQQLMAQTQVSPVQEGQELKKAQG
jgi:hypothetical protein